MGKGGRPKIEWADKEYRQVEAMCAYHCTAEEISGVMGVSEDTLSRLIKVRYKMGFSEFYKKHSASGKMSLRRSQFRLAEKSAAMAIWLGKQHLGQRDEIAVSSEVNYAEDVIKAWKNRTE